MDKKELIKIEIEKIPDILPDGVLDFIYFLKKGKNRK